MSEFEIGKIIAYNGKGCSKKEIARKLGRSRKLIQNFLGDPDAYGIKQVRTNIGMAFTFLYGTYRILWTDEDNFWWCYLELVYKPKYQI